MALVLTADQTSLAKTYKKLALGGQVVGYNWDWTLTADGEPKSC